MIKSIEEKYGIVIDKNTFYYYNAKFENNYEGYINSIKKTLLLIKSQIEDKGLKKEIFEKLLAEKENGLRALLALTGFSNEYLKRLITLIRVVDDKELSTLVYKDKWCAENSGDIKEWSDSKIESHIKTNAYFRCGIINLFFEGETVPFLVNTMPLFEIKKLSLSKLNFETPELVDTIVRYKEKGSYSGKKENNPECAIEEILEGIGVTFETGDLNELVENASDTKRTMDFIIPNKQNPIIIAESSFLVTTSSGQGDKSKTEININKLLKKHYPNATFIGFIDGIGWYVRKNDLKRMVAAYEDVFTFHNDELARFERLVKSSLGK